MTAFSRASLWTALAVFILLAVQDGAADRVLSGGGGPVLPPGVGVGRGGIPSELFDFCWTCNDFFPQARCEGIFRACSAVYNARFNKNNRAAATGLTAGSIPPFASLATKPVIAALDLLCGCGEEITLTENISMQDLVQTHYIERFPQLSALAEYVGRQVRACNLDRITFVVENGQRLVAPTAPEQGLRRVCMNLN